MHPDLSPHLHTPECNKLIAALKECHQVNKFGRFIGSCNSIDTELSKCLKQERSNNAAKNRAKAAEQQRLVRNRIVGNSTEK